MSIVYFLSGWWSGTDSRSTLPAVLAPRVRMDGRLERDPDNLNVLYNDLHFNKLINLLAVFDFAFLPGNVVMEPNPAMLHREAVVCDLHCDTALRLVEGVPLGTRQTSGHVDIPRLQEGGVDLQVFACWVNPGRIPQERFTSEAWRMIDSLMASLQQNSGSIALATSATSAEQIQAEGRIAAVLSIEGGHSIGNGLDTLRAFHNLGVRSLTLTWNNSNDWADASAEQTSRHGGLTEFGKEVIREMNQMGMIIDLSHSSDSTFWDVTNITNAPVIASHSCVYALCPHHRNLKDDQIRAIARTGGMIGINFFAAFLDNGFDNRYKAIEDKYAAEIDSLRKVYEGHFEHFLEERNRLFGPEFQAALPSLDLLMDHIDYVVRLVGPEYVGLGSDFDGAGDMPRGLTDCSKLPLITAKLVERGYSADDIKLILGGNFMRIFRRVCG